MHLDINNVVASFRGTSEPVKAFMDWPALETVAKRYIGYVSPWVIVEGEHFAVQTLEDALDSYDQACIYGYDEGYREFMKRIALSAGTLAKLKVSIKNKSKDWIIWDYEQPLITSLQESKSYLVQTRVREKPLSTPSVMIKLLAAVSPISDLINADLDYNKLLSESA